MAMTNVKKIISHAHAHPETAGAVVKAFDGFAAGLNGPGWLIDLRRTGADYVRTHGLPSAKLEGWKFTNILPLVKAYGPVLGQTKVTTLSRPDGLDIQPLAISATERDWVRGLIAEDAHYTDHNTDPALWHLANMFFRDGVSIDVPRGWQGAEPLEVVLECAPDTFNTVHTAIRVQENARLVMIEDHRGKGNYWKNRLSHIVLEPGAHFTHIRIQNDSDQAIYTQNTRVTVAKDATYDAVAVYTGARLSRNQIHAVLSEPGATCHLNGINLMRGEQHTDTTILIEHRAPHCDSRQNYRSVLNDRAHGVFQGKVHVHQPAQKTDGYQLSKAILLSEGAEMDTKPELEIYADDVKCSHGATTGQLDSEPMFYMQSRGVDENSARALLIESFVADAVEGLKDGALRERLMDVVRGWLKSC